MTLVEHAGVAFDGVGVGFAVHQLDRAGVPDGGFDGA